MGQAWCRRQRESEGGEYEDIEPDREKDEGWVSAGMRKVMGGRRGSLLKRLGSGRLGAGLEQDPDDPEVMPRPASAVSGPSRYRYLAAWTRLMQVMLAQVATTVPPHPGCALHCTDYHFPGCQFLWAIHCSPSLAAVTPAH